MTTKNNKCGPIEMFEEQDRYIQAFSAYGDARTNTPAGKPHFHLNEGGFMVKCYHRARVNPVLAFVVGTMISFPLEHYLYEKVWPFTLITTWLGL